MKSMSAKPSVFAADERMLRVEKRHPDYPPVLRHYANMPDCLYVLGALPDPAKKSAAIVGARACSPYGGREAYRFAAALAGAGVQIISGMAEGVDSYAHLGALEAGGRTFAVLGSGVDVCYPRSNRLLYEKIRRQGGVLSEFEPGAKPLPYHFPLRNRIISALADVVIVAEARKKSGSLITASLALEQGKSVFAIPGRNTDPLSAGCNALLAEGAGVAAEPELILEELGVCLKNSEKQKNIRLIDQIQQKDREDALKIVQILQGRVENLGEIVEQSGLSSARVAQILLDLSFLGIIRERAPGCFSLLYPD